MNTTRHSAKTPITLIVAALLIAAGVVRADVDNDNTQAGGTNPSGTSDLLFDQEIAELLMSVNNDMVYENVVITDPTAVLDATPRIDPTLVGQILNGSYDDVKFTYDRLAAQAVLQLLWFNDGEVALIDTDQAMILPTEVDLLASPTWSGAASSGGGQPVLTGFEVPPTDEQFEEPTIDMIPEPATLGLAILGGIGLLRRRVKQTNQAPN